MDDLSASLLIKAMDGLSTRMAVGAENIANASTQGYRPRRVTFEQALAAASREGPQAVRALQPRPEPTVDPDGVRIDLEMASAWTTSQRYAALADLLSRQLQLQSIAIKGVAQS